jgi:hypothetical protein
MASPTADEIISFVPRVFKHLTPPGKSAVATNRPALSCLLSFVFKGACLIFPLAFNKLLDVRLVIEQVLHDVLGPYIIWPK